MTDPHPFWLGYRHGKALAAEAARDVEADLKLNVLLAGTTNRKHRAFALGELRGYRQAANLPNPVRQ